MLFRRQTANCFVLALLTCLFMVLYLTCLLSHQAEDPREKSCDCSTSGQGYDKGHKEEGLKYNINDAKLCVVVPFRDRFEELQIFGPHMSDFLADRGVLFDILVINQLDLYRFNRAALINAGYYESARVNCSYFAMHDVDLLPQNPELRYAKPRPNSVYHVASPEYHPRYNYSKFIGGILIISLENFLKADGMSNRYWGWGLEDDEFFLRLRDAGLSIERPVNLTTNRSTTFKHVHDKRLRRRDNLRIGEQKNVSRRRDRISGVSTLRYHVISRVHMTIENATVTVVNVRLECDKQFSPWCEFPNQSGKRQ